MPLPSYFLYLFDNTDEKPRKLSKKSSKFTPKSPFLGIHCIPNCTPHLFSTVSFSILLFSLALSPTLRPARRDRRELCRRAALLARRSRLLRRMERRLSSVVCHLSSGLSLYFPICSKECPYFTSVPLFFFVGQIITRYQLFFLVFSFVIGP